MLEILTVSPRESEMDKIVFTFSYENQKWVLKALVSIKQWLVMIKNNAINFNMLIFIS